MIEITDLRCAKSQTPASNVSVMAHFTRYTNQLVPLKPLQLAQFPCLHDIGAERALRLFEEFARYGPVTSLHGPQYLADIQFD